MGYSHYYSTDKRTDDIFTALAYDTRRIIDAAQKGEILLGDWEGKGDPIVTDTEIAFNGLGDDLGYETFQIAKGEWGQHFCKTAERPYDAVVVAVLLRYAFLLRDGAVLHSDGDYAQWQAGARLYEAVFGGPVQVWPKAFAITV